MPINRHPFGYSFELMSGGLNRTRVPGIVLDVDASVRNSEVFKQNKTHPREFLRPEFFLKAEILPAGGEAGH